MSSRTGTLRAAPARTPWRVALVVGLWLAVAAGHWAYGDRHREYDLRIYFHAIRWWAHGHPLYDYAQPDRIQGVLGFTYPPFAAVLMTPLAVLPLGLVIALSWLANGVAVVITTAWLVGPVARRRGWPGWFAICLAVPLVTALEPIRENATFGQINMYLALLILSDLLFAVPAGRRFAGVGVGLATAIKLTPAIFIVYLLVTRRFRAAGVAIGTAVGATALTAAIVPHASWRYWTDTFWQTNRIGHLDFIPNQSMMGMLSRIARPHHASQLIWLLLVMIVACYGLWRAARASRAGDELTGITLAGLVGSLVSPVSWQHHLYWIIPALVVLLDVAASREVPRRWWYAAFGGLIWVTVTISVISFFDYHWVSMRLLDSPEGFLMSNWYVLLMLALLVFLPVRVLRPGEPAGTPLIASFRAN